MTKIINALVAILLLVPTLGISQSLNPPVDDALLQLQKFNQFYRYLNGAYVDSVKNDKLVATAIEEMLTQLDPHSSYLSPEEMKSQSEAMEGSFSGIGVEYNVLQDTIIVVNVIAGGPSEAVGLLPNDRIVGADGKSVVGTLKLDVPKLLRGPKGTKIDLKIKRKGEPNNLNFSILRKDIPITTIDAAYKANDNTAYIKVNRFAHNTYKEFVEAYNKLGKVDNVVLDLRGNGGGLLDQAIMLSNFFLPKGSVIVSTEGMRVPPERTLAKEDGQFTKGKVVVLVNESSASGSEIVAGALQDWDRGLIVGRRTFGKGLVQRQFPLVDESAIRLTVARYHTPSGRAIQRHYENGKRDDYYQELNKRLDSGVDISDDTTLVFKTLRKGRTVYGGGGIVPDISVDIDTSTYSLYWANLVRKGIIADFAVNYMDKNRSSMAKQYLNIDKFVSQFNVDNSIIDSLTTYATKNGVELNSEELARSLPDIKLQLKALFAQKLWGVNEYFIVINSGGDKAYNKALEAISDWNRLNNGVIP